MTDSLFRPKGPLPLFMADFERDTVGWNLADKYRYLLVIDHMFRQGGFIPDSENYLAEIMRLRKGRGWRETVALIRSKLTPLNLTQPESKAFAKDFLTALQSVSFFICLSQKRVLLDVKNARDRADKSRKGGHAKAAKNLPQADTRALPPSPSPSLKVEEEPSLSNDKKDSSLSKPRFDEKTSVQIKGDETEQMVVIWNVFAEEHRLAKSEVKLNPERTTWARQRLKQAGGIEGWQAAVDSIANCPYLLGDGDDGWQVSLSFLLKRESFTRLLEGAYVRKKKLGGL